MPSTAATIVGETIPFGIGSSDEAGLTTHAINTDEKVDTKEARDKFGNIVSVASYNKVVDLSIEGLGTPSVSAGGTLSLANSLTPAVTGTIVVKSVKVDRSNEDYKKVSISATAYPNITS